MYKRGLQVYMSTRRLAFVELGMVDMCVGWVPPLDCQVFFLFWLDTTLALSEISMGISKPHSASGFFFFFFLLKYPLFGLLEDGRLIVTEKVVVATYCWEFIDTPSDIDILSLHMRTPLQLHQSTRTVMKEA